MAFEVTCSQCDGLLMVEQAGQVVACPHCGAHLAIPADADAGDTTETDAAEVADADDAPAQDTAALETATLPEFPTEEAASAAAETQDGIPVFQPATDAGSPGIAMPELAPASVAPVDEAAVPVAETAAVEPAATVAANEAPAAPAVSADNPFANGAPDFGVGFGSASDAASPFGGGDFNFSPDLDERTTVDEVAPVPAQPAESSATIDVAAVATAHQTLTAPTINAEETAAAAPAEPGTVGIAAAAETTPIATAAPIATAVPGAAAGQPPAAVAPAVTAGRAVVGADTVPRSKYMLVLSWASAATIAAVFLAYLLSTSQTSQLESLPDVKPPKKDDKIVYKLVPEEVAMPPGHELVLGETQRYGNLNVTPLRVTRGPVQFEHYDSASKRTREDGPDVLKLWLRFENVSTDQSIAPLDELVFQRDDRDFENVRANTFLARVSQKSKSGTRLMVYDLNTSGDWNLKEQRVDVEIPPGGQLETYIPTTPDGLDGVLGAGEELIWRVHFRKGYSPKNYGVTTVIEVSFDEAQIEADSAAAAPATPAAGDSHDA